MTAILDSIREKVEAHRTARFWQDVEEERSDRLAELEGEAEALQKQIDAAAKKKAKAAAAVEKEDKRHEATRAKLAGERDALSQKVSGLGHRLGLIRARERDIAAAADPMVGDTRDWAWREFDRVRHRGFTVEHEVKATFAGQREVPVASSRASMEAALEYLKSAHAKLDAIALLPTNDAQREACQRLRDGLPDVVMEKV